MRDVIRSAGLRLLYARYAKAKGWNTHPMAVRQRVELYMELGTGPVAEAIADFHAHRHVWAARLTRTVIATGLVSIAIYTAYHAAPAAAEVNTPASTHPAWPADRADVKNSEGKMPRSGLEPETR